ncbi:MAG TPA: hypothetical protein ENN51_06795 [candidate division WOR-3 bacterium]|uniref:Cation-transporting P-type ATPase C-terminal domain-containing protein n=1 Tax=candidate division WOR-3 bacterium TaxID=2052148 RepID=A0A7V0T6T9_UNCW3|nr:hypothetical protein [candidate division WOR-3 bacterium]
MFGVGIAIVLQVLVIHTPVGPAVFQTVPLTPAEWARILALSSTVLIADEIRKLYGWWRRRRAQDRAIG